MSLRIARTAAVAAVFLLPACVVRLSDRNSPLPNGGVTGPAADCSQVQPLSKGAPGGEAKPKLVGRFDVTDPNRPRFDWSGNYISARFRGTEVTVGIEAPADVLFTAVVDDLPPLKFTAVPGRTGYLIAGADGPLGKLDASKEHEITLHRNTEALFGPVTFTGFNFGPGGEILPPTVRPRRIEIIGDSITCGYGNEGKNATCPFSVEVRPGTFVPITENNYLAYGSIAGRTLEADVVTVCWSGKGVVLNYREQDNDKDAKVTVPDLWLKRTLGSVGDEPPWDFATEPQPQVVVINLGTNDFSRDVDQNQIADGIDLDRFRAGYATFLEEVRKRRPDAHIFIALPPMITDQFPLDNARSNARSILRGLAEERNAAGDPKVYFIELVEQGVRYGLGCDYHPNLEVHRIMAEQVVGAIRTKTCW